MPAQGKIIDSLNRYLSTTSVKLTLNKDGICAGLVVLYLREKAAGRDKQFFHKIRKMSCLRRHEYDTQASFVSEFCRDVELSFNPGKYKSGVSQGNLDQILQMFGMSVKKKYQLGLSASKAKFCEIFTHVIKEGELIYLGANKHAVGLYKKEDKFYTYDPNADEDHDVCLGTVEQLYDALRGYFFYEKQDTSNLDLKLFIFSNPTLSPAEQLLGTFPDKKAMVASIFNQDPHNQDDAYKKALNTSLALSCTCDDVVMVEALLNKGADPFSAYDKENRSPLNLACIYGSFGIVKNLLNLENPKPSAEQLQQCLASAVMFGHSKIFFELLTKLNDYKFDKTDAYGNTLLHIAAEGYHEELLEKLIDLSPRFNLLHQNKDHQTPLMIAATNCYEKHVAVLLKQVDVSDNKAGLIEACKIAATNGSIGVLKQLMNYININDMSLEILAIAAENGQERLVSELLKNNILLSDEFLKNVLTKCNIKIINIILKKYAEKVDSHYESQFINAILEGNKDIIISLLQGKIKIEQNNIAGFTAVEILELAVSTGSNDVLEVLLNNPVMHSLIQSMGSKLLVKCCKLAYFETVNILKKHGAVNLHEEELKKMLQEACMKGDLDMVTAILNAGVSPQVEVNVEGDKYSFITLAKQLNYPDLVAAMIQRVPFLKLETALFKSLIVYARNNGYLDVIKTLLPHGFDPIKQSYHDELYKTLEISLTKNHPDITCFLLNNGINPNSSPDKDNVAKLVIQSVRLGQIEVLKLLMQKAGVAITNIFTVENKTTHENKSYFLLEEALKNKQANMALFMLEAGLDPMSGTEHGVYAMKLACEHGFVNVVQQLKIKMLDAQIEKDKIKELFLKACREGNLNSINALITVGLDVKNAENMPMFIEGMFTAIEHHHLNVVSILYELGIDLNSNLNNKSPLQLACEKRQPDIVNFILQHNKTKPTHGDGQFLIALYQLYKSSDNEKSVEIKCYEILQQAFEQGHHAIYEWTFNQKDNLNHLRYGNHPKRLVNKSIYYLSHFANAHDKVAQAKNVPADTNCLIAEIINAYKQKGLQEQQLLDHATNEDQPDVVSHLLEDKANPELANNQGLDVFEKSLKFPTPLTKNIMIKHPNPARLLDCASELNKPKVIVNLLTNGADIHKANLSGYSILEKACVRGDLEVVNALLDKQIDFCGVEENKQKLHGEQRSTFKPEKEFNTPIKFAARYGHKAIVERLLSSYNQINITHIDLMNNAIHEKDWTLLAVILETLPFDFLSKENIKKLQKFRYDIRDAFIHIMKSEGQNISYRIDAIPRLNSLLGQHNALGKLLQTPVNPFFFRFTRRVDELGNRITKSISIIKNEVGTIQQFQRNSPSSSPKGSIVNR